MSRGRWDQAQARGLEGPALCAYVSRLIGADPRLVLWGGGNSSVKTEEVDHAGRRTRAIWVKASGYDMKSITPSGFTPLRLVELEALRARASMTDGEMLSYVARCSLDPKAPRPSIETLLHAWVRAPHVYHTHADAVAGFTCTPKSRERTREAFGDGVVWVPYVRPGFQLGHWVADALDKNPRAWALVLDKHGALSWGDDARQAYDRMIRLTREAMGYQLRRARRRRVAARAGTDPGPSERRALAARLMPWLRGAAASGGRSAVLSWTDAPEVLRFLRRPDAEELSRRGPFSPDHTLQIKSRPLFWRFTDRGGLLRGVDAYRRWYADHFRRYAPPGTPPLDSFPRVALVPGVGMFTAGRDPRRARVPREIYTHTIEVLERVSAFARYTPLDPRHLGDVEFWELETYKYRLQPAEAEFAGKVVLVTGAAGAIGSETSRRFAAAGACVVIADLDIVKAKCLEEEINGQIGKESAFAVKMDVGSEESVSKAFQKAVLRFGGLDVFFSNAGIAVSSPVETLSLGEWERTFRVNSTGNYLCSREAMRLFKSQGSGGAIVLNASKNVLAPGAEFGAYSASKAAALQLARVLALEGGADGVRVNAVNPDAVFEGSGLWSKEVRRRRARAQGVAVDKLEDFYAGRNLLKARVSAGDVAEAALFLASGRSAKTTGAILPVDGGLKEAFPR